MPNSPLFIKSVIRAAHLIFTGYGHWLPNDLRGSGSSSVRAPNLKSLGPIHFGRKKQQPSRIELRTFQRNAEAELEHRVIWFDSDMRDAIARGIEQAQGEGRYTIWACAILRNHVHLVIRTNLDDSMSMLARFARHTHDAIHTLELVPRDHPVWSNRPYKVFLRNDKQIRQAIRYVEENPIKEGLAPQKWSFVSKLEK
jgi:REP element-mobilizing transposase RayT